MPCTDEIRQNRNEWEKSRLALILLG